MSRTVAALSALSSHSFILPNVRVVCANCAKKRVGMFIELSTEGNAEGSWAQLRKYYISPSG